MWHRGTVFVVQSDEIAGNHFAKDLRELRWRVHCFASVNALLERLSGQVTDAIVLRDRYDDPSLSIAAARRRAGRGAGWQDADACAQARIAAMDAGADAAGAGHEHGRMGCAAPHAVPAAAGRWASRAGLARGRTRVAGPAGERLPLTATERAFLVRLLNAPDHCLRRERFLPRNAAVERDSVRRVDVLVSRLRSKARRLDIDLPVLAVRGWGYILLARAGRRVRTHRTTRLSRCMSSGSVMLPRMRAICDEGWRRMRRVSAANS